MLSSKQLEFGETEKWCTPINDLNVGYFSDLEVIDWQSCREIFSATMKKPGFKGFYIVTRNSVDNTAKFIYKTEEVLNLSEKTTYNKTTCSEVLKINMTRFWLDSYIKRSLFTILVRLGDQYDPEKDNYEKVLFHPTKRPTEGYRYTLSAVKRFMYGFTVYDSPEPYYSPGTTLEGSGWCSLFGKADSWKKLIKKDKKASPIAIGKLWG